MEKTIYIPYLKDRLDGVMWKESDYHKQKRWKRRIQYLSEEAENDTEV
ncbi:TPA: hypothetical protein ACGOWW_001000 [Streptococcus suis]